MTSYGGFGGPPGNSRRSGYTCLSSIVFANAPYGCASLTRTSRLVRLAAGRERRLRLLDLDFAGLQDVEQLVGRERIALPAGTTKA